MTDNFKVETPTARLDKIFNLDCLKLNDMKAVFVEIYGHLGRFGGKMDELDKRMNAIPDFTKLQKQLHEHEKRLNEQERKVLNNTE